MPKMNKIKGYAAIAATTALIGCNIYINIQIQGKTMPGEEMIIGPILGQLMAGVNDQRQMQMQGRLMQQQIMGQKELTDYNQKVALDTWDKTNYAAQVKQLEKAGLNVGLMYKQGGPGGSLQVTPGSVTGGQAPHGGGEQQAGAQMAMNLKLMEAQLANINADTMNKISENPNIPKQGTLTEANTRLANINADLKGIEKDIATQTLPDVVNSIQRASETATEQALQAGMKTQEDSETLKARITQINNGVIEQGLRMTMQKANILNTDLSSAQIEEATKKLAADINNMSVQQAQEWKNLDQKAKQLWINEKMMKLNLVKGSIEAASTAARTITDLISLPIDNIGKLAGAVGKVK
ncbi:MAG: DNA pilot protein [Microviridae sp.]|nr:MAG: DNA pilot protein [Microviridae sp.]